MTELWKPVVGYEDLYEVSTLGRVRSFKHRHKFLTAQITHRGYPKVTLCCNGLTKGLVVHRLMAKAFIPNPDQKPQVNHKNGIKTDNRVENLEWCTNAENQRHAESLGFIERNAEWFGNHRLTAEKVLAIRDEYNAKKPTLTSLGIKYSITRQAISNIVHNVSWRHLTFDDEKKNET